MNDILIRTGVSNRAETDEPDAENDAATWRARYEQAQERIAELKENNRQLVVMLVSEHEDCRVLRAERDTARRSAAAWKRAAKLYERIAQSVSCPWFVEACRRSFRDARHGRTVLTNEEYQRQWWDALDMAEERTP